MQYSNCMASNKKDKPKRRYELRERARRLEETRRRITEAAVDLHGTVGPAQTTVSEVARVAGVQRMTVYNHFATDADLFDACSAHWLERNPLPDPARWRGTDDPVARTELALRNLYGYYHANERMIGNLVRDTPLIPALAAIMEQKWVPRVLDMLAVLADGFGSGAEPGAARVAALRVALDFTTWRTLTQSGLDDDAAARLATRMVAAAPAPHPVDSE